MRVYVTFLAGPVIWLGHFMLVYLVVEAGCTTGAEGTEPRLLGVPALSAFTLATTVAATAAALFFAHRGYRASQGGGGADERALGFAGLLLGLMFAVAILFVGVPAVWLRAC